MGAGKTTVGKKMARRLGCSFVDMDVFIENRYHKAVSELFAEKGEAFFREIEQHILQEVSLFENTVISTGGGTPCFFDNMEQMNRAGLTVYLKVSVDELTQRLVACKQERPLLKDKTRDELKRYVADHLEQRETYYKRAHILFPAEPMQTRKDLETLVDHLIRQINEQTS